MADIYRAAKALPPAIFWARSPREAALAGLATNAFASVAVPSEARWGVVRTKPCGGAGLAEWADLVDRMSGMTNLDSLSRIRVGAGTRQWGPGCRLV